MSRSSRSGETILILGGAGMVGEQVAREAARQLRPARIVIAALTEREVADAIANLKPDLPDVELVAAPGNIFVPQSLQGIARGEILSCREKYDALFSEIFSPDVDWSESALYQLIKTHDPEIVVDCINTATAISYQDEFKGARKTKALLDQVEAGQSELVPQLLDAVRELLISQGVPQITRHILFLHRALQQSRVRIYVKVGTTGTGGMGINIPFTHSEDKPSPQLIAKSAIGFAHTGLLFLLARTPAAEKQAVIIKEVKPGAMIGFKRLGEHHIKLRGDRDPAYLVAPREEAIGSSLETQQSRESYGKFEGKDVPLKIIGADTGENGFFSIGEFRAITYPRQMEYVTPEEVARTAVLEILGASTGRDVISAIDGAITDPSYRAGVLRDQAIREMERLEEAFSNELLPSIAVGHLGPPKLTKLLAEAYLIRQAAGTDDIQKIVAMKPADMQKRVEQYLEANPRIVSLITTIGIPLVRENGGKLTLTRGPRINIPPLPPNTSSAPLPAGAADKYAKTGWVDLRIGNFETWAERLHGLAGARPDIARKGSAAFDIQHYATDRFVPGEAVGWLLANEIDEQGMVGHRL